MFKRRIKTKLEKEVLIVTFTGRLSTTKLNSSPHIGFLDPGTMELQGVRDKTKGLSRLLKF
jgi:hypothetical protein